MNNGIKIPQIIRCQIANVFAHQRHLGAIGHKRALVEIACVQARDLIACLREARSQDRADIPVVPGYEHASRQAAVFSVAAMH